MEDPQEAALIKNRIAPGSTYNESHIMAYFEYKHLPEELRMVSKDLCKLARHMDETLPNGAEKSAGLRKLLEAKDCFVRAVI